MVRRQRNLVLVCIVALVLFIVLWPYSLVIGFVLIGLVVLLFLLVAGVVINEQVLREPKAPVWHEWNVPTLQQWSIQANVNVAKLEASEDSSFGYWLTLTTLEKGHPIKIPVKLAGYHKEALKEKKINSSVFLNKRDGMWWLTLSYDEEVAITTAPDAPTVGIDVGIANFITTSTGKHYGTMHGKLKARHKRDRAKRRRKVKLRACLEKKGVKKLPSTSSCIGRWLIRQTKQEINQAVNECFNDPDHAGKQFAYEQLLIASMRFKARAMNAYLRASNLAHVPHQIKWNSQKRGVLATPVISAYSSQECSVCHYMSWVLAAMDIMKSQTFHSTTLPGSA